jgi:hypothetical protein
MLNIKCSIIPVIIGATGMVTKSLKKNAEAMPGERSVAAERVADGSSTGETDSSAGHN